MSRTTPTHDRRPWSPLLTVAEVAERLRIPVQTLYYWRTQGLGPKSVLVGRHLRFREDDLLTWLDAQPSAAA